MKLIYFYSQEVLLKKSFEIDSFNMSVDCGATAHIITDKSKIVRIEKDFNES